MLYNVFVYVLGLSGLFWIDAIAFNNTSHYMDHIINLSISM